MRATTQKRNINVSGLHRQCRRIGKRCNTPNPTVASHSDTCSAAHRNLLCLSLRSLKRIWKRTVTLHRRNKALIKSGYERLAAWAEASGGMFSVHPPQATALGFVRYHGVPATSLQVQCGILGIHCTAPPPPGGANSVTSIATCGCACTRLGSISIDNKPACAVLTMASI